MSKTTNRFSPEVRARAVQLVLDQERAAAKDTLQSAVDDGISSSASEPFDIKAFKQKMHERYAAK